MAEVPLLFLKTGIIKGEPDEFCETLADKYTSNIYSVRKAMDQLRRGQSVRKLRQEALFLTRQRTSNSLRGGSNVVLDSLTNSYQNRRKFKGVALATGSRVVLMAFWTPPHVIQERFDSEIEAAKQFPDGNSTLHIVHRKLEIAGKMAKNIEWPLENEAHLLLHGQKSTPELLGDVASYVQAEIFGKKPQEDIAKP